MLTFELNNYFNIVKSLLSLCKVKMLIFLGGIFLKILLFCLKFSRILLKLF